MSSASSAVTYTSVYTDSEPGRVFWGADEEIPDGGVPRVIVYGYDGLPMQPVDPPSPDYVPGPEHPSSPDYVPGPEHPPSPIEIPYIPEPEFTAPEYLDDILDMNDMRTYRGRGGRTRRRREHHSTGPTTFCYTPMFLHQFPLPGRYRGRGTEDCQPEPKNPMSHPGASHCWHAAGTYTTTTWAAGIRMRAAVASPPSLLPSTSPRTDVPKAEMPPRKRACLTTPALGCEIGESSAAGAVRQPKEGRPESCQALIPPIRQRTEEFERPHVRSTGGTGLPLDYQTTHFRPVDFSAWTYCRHKRLETQSPRWTPAEAGTFHGSEPRKKASSLLNGECTYTDFLKCQPMNFKALKSRWPDPMGEKIKLFFPYQQLAIQVERYQRFDNYNQRFQELALMFDRMSRNESAVESGYVGGLLRHDHGSVRHQSLINARGN
ncbi:hypothetical protein Tco_0300043 [Tanacetum coccineum]